MATTENEEFVKKSEQWLIWVTKYKSLIQHFRLSVAMATIENEEFVQLFYARWTTIQQIFIKKVLSKYLAIKAHTTAEMRH